MAGRIPSHFIDELLARVDVVDVIDARVPLKKAGREFTACCPFHNEKTPSFTVSREKQFYHCFGCGQHGSAISFLMEYEHLGFVEAVEELASMVGLEVPREAGLPEEGQGHRKLYTVMEKAATFYRNQLRSHPQAGRATDYLKGRGLTGEIAAEFELGFAPPGWDTLAPALKGEGVSAEELMQVGMLIRKDDGGYYDRFRDRVMFPIRDSRGRVIAFGGRQLEKEDGAKYLNSPETPIFHKGGELYGLYQARKAVRKLERLLVVEGYMDVVSLAQFGVRNAVATLGTATTKEHLERLFRVVPQVVFCFDGDRAGRQAAWRALENALPAIGERREISFMFLPEGEDPDTLIRQEGREAFGQRVAAAMPLSEFFFDALLKTVDISTIEGRKRLLEQAKPLIKKLPEGDFRRMMAARLGEIANIDQSALAGSPAPQGGIRAGAATPGRAAALGDSPVRRGIRFLLQQPALAGLVQAPQDLRGLELPGMELFVDLIELLQANPHLTCGAILEHWRAQEAGRHLSKLAQTPLLTPDEGLEMEFRGILDQLEHSRIQQEYERLTAKARAGSLTDEEKRQYAQLVTVRRGAP